jgi:hypothetical protein
MTTEVEQTTPDQTRANEEAQARGEIEAAFSATQDGTTPTATPAPAPQQVEEVQAEVVAPEPAPEYAQITKQEYEAILARAAEIDQIKATQEKSLGTAFGKIGGIERRLAEMSAAPTAPVFDFSDDEIAGLKDDWPQLAAALGKLKSAKPAAIDYSAAAEHLKPNFEQIRNDALTAARQELRAELLAEKHEDWELIVASQAFDAFTKAQPATFQASLAKASQDWNHREIAKAITSFKEAQARATANANARRSRLESAVNPRGTAPVAQTASAEEELLAGFKQA